MLKIRDAQMSAVARGTRLARIGELMRQAHPEECARLGAAEARHRVATGLEQARHHGIEDPTNAIRYVSLMFLFRTDALDAPDSEWATNILGWEADEETRLAALERRARQLLGAYD